MEQQLQQRFPFTTFEFVEAGISSTGSTPGAFRLDNDVLSKGKIDLLFIDGSANDMTNGFTPEEQVRGVEGEIRHALEVNPETDIVLTHFATDGFLPIIARRQMPDAILNYERVANHYRVSSVNLAQEISERLQDGQFTWKEFGYAHPHPYTVIPKGISSLSVVCVLVVDGRLQTIGIRITNMKSGKDLCMFLCWKLHVRVIG